MSKQVIYKSETRRISTTLLVKIPEALTKTTEYQTEREFIDSAIMEKLNKLGVAA